jgi:hypothetical protein
VRRYRDETDDNPYIVHFVVEELFILEIFLGIKGIGNQCPKIFRITFDVNFLQEKRMLGTWLHNICDSKYNSNGLSERFAN